ncbi:MAG TPA: hypothetical protein VME17_24270 [Bryobacteraceae bacterium]|nr:hypothetical protein [Bryobacteraceae bacterium]
MNPAPPQPVKKSRIILWVLLGVCGFFALILFVVVVGGRILVRQAGLSGAHISVEDASKGQFQVQSPNGSVQIGGAAKIPAWLPEYPGSNAQNAVSAQNNSGRSGTFTFKTADSPDRVLNYYRGQLQGSGLAIAAVVNAGPSKVLTAEDHDKHHTVNVVITGEGETSVTVAYTSK